MEEWQDFSSVSRKNRFGRAINYPRTALLPKIWSFDSYLIGLLVALLLLLRWTWWCLVTMPGITNSCMDATHHPRKFLSPTLTKPFPPLNSLLLSLLTHGLQFQNHTSYVFSSNCQAQWCQRNRIQSYDKVTGESRIPADHGNIGEMIAKLRFEPFSRFDVASQVADIVSDNSEREPIDDSDLFCRSTILEDSDVFLIPFGGMAGITLFCRKDQTSLYESLSLLFEQRSTWHISECKDWL